MQVIWSKTLPYNPDNVDNVKNELGGIYYLLRDNPEGGYFVFYVGKGNPLRGRLEDHLKDDEINDCIKSRIKKYDCYFKYAYVDNEKDRSCAERYMYDHWDKPLCNKKEPEGPPCKINLD